METEIERLITAVGHGDMGALETLYRQLRESVYLYALSLLNDRATAEDVLQDTFVQVARRAGTHIPGKSGKAWICAIARNLCLDRLRSPARKVRALDEAEDGPAQPCVDFVSDCELREAMGRLDEEPRRIVLLHLAAGFTFREIAKLRGRPQPAVQWMYYSAVRKLSSYYAETRREGVDRNETVR